MTTGVTSVLAQTVEGGNWNLFVFLASVGAFLNLLFILRWWPKENSSAKNRGNGFGAKATLLMIASLIGMGLVTMSTNPAVSLLNYFIIMLPTAMAAFPLSYWIFINPREGPK
jgi:hypothetical protein